MRHSIRTFTLFGGLALTAAFSGCNAEETPSSTPAPVSVPPVRPNPSPATAVKDMNPGDSKGGDVKAPDTRPADTKTADTKTADTKAPDTKPAETKPADTKPSLEPPAASKDTPNPKS